MKNDIEPIEYVSFHIQVDNILNGNDVNVPEIYKEVLPYIDDFKSTAEHAYSVLSDNGHMSFTITDDSGYFTLIDYTTRVYDVDYIKISTIDWGDIEYESYIYDGSANLFFTANKDFFNNIEKYHDDFIRQSIHCLIDQYFTVKDEKEQYGEGITVIDNKGNIKFKYYDE